MFEKSDVPPIAEIEGVDLVTEGVITINKVLEYARDFIADNKMYDQWSIQHDGAALISRMLFEEATDISFYVDEPCGRVDQVPYQDGQTCNGKLLLIAAAYSGAH